VVHIADGCKLLIEQLYYLSQKSRLDEHVLFPEQVATILGARVEDTNTVVDFLETSGYIKCGRPFGKPYSWIKLTSKGQQLVVHASLLEQAFEVQPPTQLQPGISSQPPIAKPEESIRSHFEYAVHTRDTVNIQKLVEGTEFPMELVAEMKESLYHVAEALEQKDDGPLRELLTTLILKGGLETTLVGVKALLAVCGMEI
jgi:hypothetical protein